MRFTGHKAPHKSRYLPLVSAFAAVYVIWGSTYLFIHFADETLPPFLMAGTRFLVAGALAYIWARVHGAKPAARRQWRSAGVVGVLLLVGGNGGVVWSEQFLPSSLVALLISTVPIWIAVLAWAGPERQRPSLATTGGLLLGFLGVVLLLTLDAGQRVTTGGSSNPLFGLVVLVAAISWAAGSLYSRSASLPHEPLLGIGMEMLVGGAVLIALGLATGELGKVDLGAISTRSALSLAYLIVFGSLVAYTAYIWLLQHVPVTRVATYAYVNPIVAVLLGWAFDHEPLTWQTLLAAAVIVLSIVVVTSFRPHPSLAARKNQPELLPDSSPDASTMPRT